MRNPITPKLISCNLPGLPAMLFQNSFKEPLSSRTISALLKEHIYNFSVLIHRSPQVVLLATNLDEYFINKKSITVS